MDFSFIPAMHKISRLRAYQCARRTLRITDRFSLKSIVIVNTRYETDNLRIVSVKRIPPPGEVHAQYPINDEAAATTFSTRHAIDDALHDEEDRLVVVCGPCSIHDVDAAMEYAQQLKVLIDQYAGELLLIMRVYFEKPRTTIGWKGLINDPFLDNTFQINKGIQKARKLLLDLNMMGVPAATEYLDMLSPQYYSDLISWGAIGARTTESQSHRELASGLSCPVGFKNGTDGNIQIAVDAIGAASKPHHFLSRTKSDTSAIYETSGNDCCHLILRGGTDGPNYKAKDINDACEKLKDSGLKELVMVDLSHANSRKDPDRQVDVAADIAQQIAGGEHRVMGVMIESHLVHGNQKHEPGKTLVYGQSITDACIDMTQTKAVLANLAAAVKTRRANKAG